ncbi:MAG: hypothetical protein Q4D38_05620 [Planctomycetia bacterium]|nr:hypothetical protein [Planctomycetia bacterium]
MNDERAQHTASHDEDDFMFLTAYGSFNYDIACEADFDKLHREFIEYSVENFASFEQGKEKYDALAQKILSLPLRSLGDHAAANDLLWSIECNLLELGLFFEVPSDILIKHFSNMVQITGLGNMERTPQWACILAQELHKRGEKRAAERIFFGAVETIQRLQRFCSKSLAESISPIASVFVEKSP